MTLYDYLRTLRDRWRAVAAVVLAALLVGATVLLAVPARYAASARVLFGVSGETDPGQLTRTTAYTAQLARTYAGLAELPVVLQPVIDDLGLDVDVDGLAARVQARARNDSLILQVTATDTSPDAAARIANAVAEQLTLVVSSTNRATVLDPGAGTSTGTGTGPLFSAQVISPARPPTVAVFPRPRPVLAISVAAGVFLGVILAIVIGARDRLVMDRHSAAAATRLHVVGSIPRPRKAVGRTARRDRLVRGKANEAAATLLALTTRTRARTIAFTSAYSDDTCVRSVVTVGQALCRLGLTVAMVDADLRSPRLLSALQPTGDRQQVPGLTDVLAGRAQWREAMVVAGPGAPALLSTGTAQVGADPFVSPLFPHLLQQLRAAFDIVLVKAPPSLKAADGLLVSALVDKVVIVADEAAMSQRSLIELEQSLQLVGADPVGLILSV